MLNNTLGSKEAGEFSVEEKVVYLCSECGGAFETQDNIVQHMTTVHKDVHSIRALLKIQDQLKQQQKKSMVRMRKHVGLFQCEHCPYQTQFRTTYNRHIMWHEKKYQKCPHCRFKSVQLHNLRLHLRRQHPIPTTAANTSGRKLHNLRLHLRQQHPIPKAAVNTFGRKLK